MNKTLRLAGACAGVGLMLAACAHTTAGQAFEMALTAAGLTRDAYCELTPEARAEVRRKLDIATPIIACRGDAAAVASGERR